MNQSISAFKISMVLCLVRTFFTLSFAIISFSLIFYTTEQLKFDTHFSTALVGGVFALSALLYFVSGYLGGKYLTGRHLFLLSVFLLFVSCLLLIFGRVSLLPLGLSLFVVGEGMGSTCINNTITRLFQNRDTERETAFFWNYSGLNLGFFIGLCLSGWFLINANYSAIFLCAAISSLMAAFIFIGYWNYFKETLKTNISTLQSYGISYFIIAVCILVLFVMFNYPDYGNNVTLYLGLIVYMTSFILMIKYCRDYFYNILSFYFLALITLVFWMIFQIGPMALMVFIDKSVDLVVFGVKIAPQWLANVNTLAIVLGGPVFSWAIKALREKGFIVSDYTLFTIAMILMGSSFLILPIGMKLTSIKMMHMGWIATSFFLQSIGELCLAPVGYSLVGKLIPSEHQSKLMGIWMMMFGISAVASAYFSQLMMINSTNAVFSNDSFFYWFMVLGTSAIIAALLVYLFSLVITKKVKSISNE
jgi:POT family proton-dependent oligopeptide transporter